MATPSNMECASKAINGRNIGKLGSFIVHPIEEGDDSIDLLVDFPIKMTDMDDSTYNGLKS